jgi:hypothetical protein
VSDDQRRRIGPIVFDWTITLADVAAILLGVSSLVYTFAVLTKDVQGQEREIKRVDTQHTERLVRIEARQDATEVRVFDKLERINEKLDQLIGRVNGK